MAYPVAVTLPAQLTGRNRLTVGFRLLLAIPHAILVGPVLQSHTIGTGLIALAAYFLAIVNWFAILFTGKPIDTIREFDLFYLRWRTRAISYMALFRDEYPPFGDAPYPASIEVGMPVEPRDVMSIALRLLFAMPHLIVLMFMLLAWFVTSVIAWVAILFTGDYPASFYGFGVGVMQWMLRVEAYLLLLVDEYPPFSLA